jgi:hypothetical protein
MDDLVRRRTTEEWYDRITDVLNKASPYYALNQAATDYAKMSFAIQVISAQLSIEILRELQDARDSREPDKS